MIHFALTIAAFLFLAVIVACGLALVTSFVAHFREKSSISRNERASKVKPKASEALINKVEVVSWKAE